MVKKQARKYFIPLYDRRVSRVFRFNSVLAMKIVPPPPLFFSLTLKSNVVVVGDCGCKRGKLFCKIFVVGKCWLARVVGDRGYKLYSI